jgi:hypothetical protein
MESTKVWRDNVDPDMFTPAGVVDCDVSNFMRLAKKLRVNRYRLLLVHPTTGGILNGRAGGWHFFQTQYCPAFTDFLKEHGEAKIDKQSGIYKAMKYRPQNEDDLRYVFEEAAFHFTHLLFVETGELFISNVEYNVMEEAEGVSTLPSMLLPKLFSKDDIIGAYLAMRPNDDEILDRSSLVIHDGVQFSMWPASGGVLRTDFEYLLCNIAGDFMYTRTFTVKFVEDGTLQVVDIGFSDQERSSKMQVAFYREGINGRQAWCLPGQKRKISLADIEDWNEIRKVPGGIYTVQFHSGAPGPTQYGRSHSKSLLFVMETGRLIQMNVKNDDDDCPVFGSNGPGDLAPGDFVRLHVRNTAKGGGVIWHAALVPITEVPDPENWGASAEANIEPFEVPTCAAIVKTTQRWCVGIPGFGERLCKRHKNMVAEGKEVLIPPIPKD